MEVNTVILRFPFNNFGDSYEAIDSITLPSRHALQQRLYNMVAYPFSDKYQNSNQWALEFFAQVHSWQPTVPITNPKQAQQWLKLTNYEFTTMKLGPMTRLGARMFKANVAFDDQSNERRFADLIDTVTTESIVAYVRKMDASSNAQVIRQVWQKLI